MNKCLRDAASGACLNGIFKRLVKMCRLSVAALGVALPVTVSPNGRSVRHPLAGLLMAGCLSSADVAAAAPVYVKCVPEQDGGTFVFHQLGIVKIAENDIRHWGPATGWGKNLCVGKDDEKTECIVEVDTYRISTRSYLTRSPLMDAEWRLERRTGRLTYRTRNVYLDEDWKYKSDARCTKTEEPKVAPVMF